RKDQKIAAVESILANMGLQGVPQIRVYNKWDLLTAEERAELPASRSDSLYVSAAGRKNLAELLDRIDQRVFALTPPGESKNDSLQSPDVQAGSEPYGDADGKSVGSYSGIAG
ncbi:MAG: hypothetical protein RIF32_17555, partial [Leptospirales bacterium]